MSALLSAHYCAIASSANRHGATTTSSSEWKHISLLSTWNMKQLREFLSFNAGEHWLFTFLSNWQVARKFRDSALEMPGPPGLVVRGIAFSDCGVLDVHQIAVGPSLPSSFLAWLSLCFLGLWSVWVWVYEFSGFTSISWLRASSHIHPCIGSWSVKISKTTVNCTMTKTFSELTKSFRKLHTLEE